MLEYKKNMRVPHFSFLIISICEFNYGSLSVLRVLKRQTLGFITEVKDPSFLIPILAKVVKYSTLTILFRLDHSQLSFVNIGAPL